MIFPETNGDINCSNGSNGSYVATRRGTVKYKNVALSPKYLVRRATNSLNGETKVDLLIDEQYIGYHRDRPKPD